MEVIEKVKELITPIASERKYLIVDITYKCEGGKHVLRVLADKEGGITMDECSRLNNELGELLDAKNTIEEQYVIEVSSPGLDRSLKKDSDFAWAVGRIVRVTTYEAINGEKLFSGTLLGLGNGTIVVEIEGLSTEIRRDKIASARLAYTE